MIEAISVVVPVYNGALTLPELTSRLVKVLSSLTDSSEIILINDGSLDGSWSVISALVAQYHPCVVGMDLMRNYGQHNALLAGIRQAHHDVIVTLDDDLQNPPEEIPRLLAKLREGYDVVYGTPIQEQHGLWRDLASHITKIALQSAMGAETARNVSAFRVFRTQLRDAFAHYRSSFVSVDVLLTWSTTRFASLPVQHEPRRVGKSNYTFRKLLTHALNMVTGFSTLPLQIASMTGFLFTFVGVILFLYVVGRYVAEGGSVPGFPFLASMIAILSGAQLFALGIIGEYLARMHFRTMEKPLYCVRALAEPRQNVEEDTLFHDQ